MTGKKNSSIHLVLLPIVFFIAIPLLFIRDNIEDIERLDLVLFPTLGVLALFCILILIVANTLLSRVFVMQIFNNATEIVFIYIIAAGFVFSVSVSTGMVDQEHTPVNWSNLVLVLISAGTMFWIARGKYGQLLYSGHWVVVFCRAKFFACYLCDCRQIRRGWRAPVTL